MRTAWARRRSSTARAASPPPPTARASSWPMRATTACAPSSRIKKSPATISSTPTWFGMSLVACSRASASRSEHSGGVAIEPPAGRFAKPLRCAADDIREGGCCPPLPCPWCARAGGGRRADSYYGYVGSFRQGNIVQTEVLQQALSLGCGCNCDRINTSVQPELPLDRPLRLPARPRPARHVCGEALDSKAVATESTDESRHDGRLR